MKLRLWCLATLLAGCTIDGERIDPDKHIFPIDDPDPAPDPIVAELAPSDTNGIALHGGDVMGTVNVYYIWYGDWLGNSAIPILTDVANGIGRSLYWSIATTYFGATGTHVPGTVRYGGQTA